MGTEPEALTTLASALNALPGIGPRSAERLALHLVQSDAAAVKHLAEVLVRSRERIQTCHLCGSLTETQPCDFCSSDRRDPALLCLVEQPVDVIRMEKSETYRGRYHVLGGKISPLNGVEPEDLRIEELENRLLEEPIQEVIIALGTDVEGDATAFYLAKRLSARGVKVTRIAHGLPAGSGLEFADQLTLARALEGRRDLTG